ncbi:uncharacterized protein EAF01_006596 [Botrytis porri]|uniref:Uncharacterized protein n=1 Tax=Botrytis porri TaxID=87229 RepID=A0A4Z1KYQ7_9HELO|nr:uncharacterized protein EAF01_006596 [Botrytis porri]KAF7903547.1 hypothetical protein EAF01_006596 [Botrytis porri]TGO89644.1 hypothetical protein BPOR_0100g00260 [Botrytis porri]
MPYFSSISDTMWMCCDNASRDNQGCGERNKMTLDKCSKCSHKKCDTCRVTRLQLLMEDFINTDKVKEALESQLKEISTVRSNGKGNEI